MLTVAAIGVTAGVLRNGIMNWYRVFANQAKQPGTGIFHQHWGLLGCISGILGGFVGRLCFGQVFSIAPRPACRHLLGLHVSVGRPDGLFLFKSQWIVGWAAVLITMFVIGVHSLMAGTAAPDFGGRKATATCSGIADGFVYLGSSMQSFALGLSDGHKLVLVAGVPDALRGFGNLPRDFHVECAARRHAEIHCPMRAKGCAEPRLALTGRANAMCRHEV
jgi:sugar phosphate permease